MQLDSITLRLCRKLADGLDHPEAVAVGMGGELYAGGEAGQVYRIDQSGSVAEIARLEGFVAGVTVDAIGNLYVCDTGSGRVVRIAQTGEVSPYTTGERLVFPNFTAFDSQGNLYLTDSGDYDKANGRLLLVRPTGEVEVLVGGYLHYPNGLTVDPRHLALPRTKRRLQHSAVPDYAERIRGSGDLCHHSWNSS